MTIAYFIERDPETAMYVAVTPSIPGAHTMCATIEELQENLREVITMCLEELAPEDKEPLPQFISLGKLEVII